jgi:hypothetical protein
MSNFSFDYSHHHQVFQGGQEDHGDPWDPTNKVREFKRWLEDETNNSGINE